MATVDGGTCHLAPLCMLHDGSRPVRASRLLKLTERAVEEIRAYEGKLTDLPGRYGVSYNHILRVRASS